MFTIYIHKNVSAGGNPPKGHTIAYLEDTSESTSSMKMMLGFSSLAFSNRLFTIFSDSPCHLDMRSALLTEKNVDWLASVATALAR